METVTVGAIDYTAYSKTQKGLFLEVNYSGLGIADTFSDRCIWIENSQLDTLLVQWYFKWQNR